MSNASAVSPHAGREGQHRNGAVAPRLSCRHGTADTPGPDRRLTVRTAPDSSARLSGRRTGPGTRHSHRRRRALRALGASPPAATRTCGSPRGNSWRARGVTLHQAERRRCNVVTRLAGSTGFEPATSGLTGRRVGDGGSVSGQLTGLLSFLQSAGGGSERPESAPLSDRNGDS